MAITFIDTNIFMYAIGASHPHKAPSTHLVQKILAQQVEAAINTEVLQEVLYRYTAIGKPGIGYQLFDTLIATFGEIWPVDKEDAIAARKLQERYAIKPRDAIHAATMRHNGVTTLYSYDTDFDKIPGFKRIVP
ncbi:MAG: type II toxin-antitoxin system VapC family toxin [Deltaproteobacteria bacterium]|nr:type II toxin-antitoxin system VapC family toxin [Deltaproteobacteria bacterium]